MNILQAVNAADKTAMQSQNAAGMTDNAEETFDSVIDKKTRTLEDIFQDVAKEYEVPVDLLKAVAQAESGFDANAVSSCGASGIMQLMPKTAEGLGVEDVFDPEQNITGGAKMLAYLLDDYDGDTTLALAAYNAGSGAVAKYGGVPPYEETRNYIRRINDILDGGLEKDLSYISADNTSRTSGQGSTSEVLRGGTPVKISNGKENTVEDLFPYDDYLKFIAIYMKMLGTTIGEPDDEEDASGSAQKISEQQKFYELERMQMSNNLSRVLFGDSYLII